MLNGFANENMGQNRFMARTRQLNSSFSNAIGTKEVTPLPDIYRNMRKAPIGQPYANAIGSKTSTILINPVGYQPYKCGANNSCGQGHRCITNGTNVATGEVANWCVPFAEWERLMRQRAFDGGFANAIGKTTYVKPSPTTPAPAYTSCGGHSGSTACYSCPQFNSTMASAEGCPIAEGNYSGSWDSDFLLNGCGCSYNPPVTVTKPTSLQPTNVSVKFDGGFANAYGNPVQRATRPLVNNPYKNVGGDCGCGCNGDALLGL